MSSNKKTKLANLYLKYINCKNCPLAKQGRSKIVFGDGDPNAKLMFIGEGPGRDEDLQGKPFTGKAGQLLTKIINSLNLQRSDVFISNVVKCRPPKNRATLFDEAKTCKTNILFKEIEIIKPKIICTLGNSATQALLGKKNKITSSRGIFFKFKNIDVIPTFHPAYLLRKPTAKKAVDEDMQKILEKLK